MDEQLELLPSSQRLHADRSSNIFRNEKNNAIREEDGRLIVIFILKMHLISLRNKMHFHFGHLILEILIVCKAIYRKYSGCFRFAYSISNSSL